LEGENKDDSTQESGKGDKFLAAKAQHTVHKKDLRHYQEEREGNEDDPPEGPLGFAFKQTKNGDDRKEDSYKCCHGVQFSQNG
jgi:hypothetical protein